MPRSESSTDDSQPAPDPSVSACAVLLPGAGDFSFAIYAQLAEVLKAQSAMQRDIGSILSTQAASSNRIGKLESKVAGLIRLVWIGIGVGGTIAAVAAGIVPVMRALVQSGVVTL